MGESLVELEGEDESVEGRLVEQRDHSGVEGRRLLQASAAELRPLPLQGQAALAARVEVEGQGGQAGVAKVVILFAGVATQGTAGRIQPLLYTF